MSEQQRAYLVIHKIAWYNDEFYIDFTDDSKFADPAGLFNTPAEAQAYARRLTRKAMPGAYWYDLLPDLDTLHSLDTLADQPNKYGLKPNFQAGEVIPQNLTDGQLDELIDLIGVKIFTFWRMI